MTHKNTPSKNDSTVLHVEWLRNSLCSVTQSCVTLTPWTVSEEVRRGAQGDSLQASGKSGLHAHGDGERVFALESW